MKSTISFVGHDDGVPVSFRIRVKTAEQAQELKDAFDREVAAVKESN
jgi:nucleoporin NUP2